MKTQLFVLFTLTLAACPTVTISTSKDATLVDSTVDANGDADTDVDSDADTDSDVDTDVTPDTSDTGTTTHHGGSAG